MWEDHCRADTVTPGADYSICSASARGARGSHGGVYLDQKEKYRVYKILNFIALHIYITFNNVTKHLQVICVVVEVLTWVKLLHYILGYNFHFKLYIRSETKTFRL